RLGEGQPPRLAAAQGRRQRGEVDQGQSYRRGGPDLLHGLAIDEPEDGAQGLVPACNLAQSGRQGGGVERAVELQGEGDVVVGPARPHLVEHPELLLRERERERAAALRRGDGGLDLASRAEGL